MDESLTVKWVDSGREPKCDPDPNYPFGIDLDASNGSSIICSCKLPYPAKCRGYFVVECNRCNQRVVITTAGRPDDPKSLKLACKTVGNA